MKKRVYRVLTALAMTTILFCVSACGAGKADPASGETFPETEEESAEDSDAENVDHCRSYVGVDNGHATCSYTIRDGQPIYETQWVVTQEAWTETTVVGYEWTTCGAVK